MQNNLALGALAVVPADWAEVHRLAERLSATHTVANGFRTMDTLHVATALHLGAREFLTFNLRQRQLVIAEGLKPRP